LTAGATTIDGCAPYVRIIDEHTHIALFSVNEIEDQFRRSSSGDVVDSEDIDIYRQLAGGVTAACLITVRRIASVVSHR
jgi:hypothetical protein